MFESKWLCEATSKEAQGENFFRERLYLSLPEKHFFIRGEGGVNTCWHGGKGEQALSYDEAIAWVRTNCGDLWAARFLKGFKRY